MNESEATPIAEQLAKAVGTGGTLRFFGDWFGRPHDNFHRLESATVDEESLVLRFDGGGAVFAFSVPLARATADAASR